MRRRGFKELVPAVLLFGGLALPPLAAQDSAPYREDRVLKNVDADGVESVAWSPDGKILASGGKQGKIKLWDPITGRLLRALVGHGWPVRTLAFHPKGKVLASGSYDRTARLWDVESGEELHQLRGHTDHVQRVVFSPDGTILASGGKDGFVKFWDPATGKETRSLGEGTSAVLSLAFTPRGDALLAGHKDGKIKMWLVKSGKEIKLDRGHEGKGGRMFSEKEYERRKKEIRGEAKAAVKRLEQRTERKIAKIDEEKNQAIWKINVERRWKLKAAQGDKEKMAEINKEADRRIAAQEDDARTRKREIRNKSDDELSLIRREAGEMLDSLDNEKRRLINTERDFRDFMKKTKTDKSGPVLPFPSPGVTGLVLSPDGKRIVSGSVDGTIMLWAPLDREELGTVATGQGMLMAVAFSPEGKLIVSGGWDQTIRFWDAASGKARGVLKGHSHYVASVAFRPDGKLLASASIDGTVRIWRKKE